SARHTSPPGGTGPRARPEPARALIRPKRPSVPAAVPRFPAAPAVALLRLPPLRRPHVGPHGRTAMSPVTVSPHRRGPAPPRPGDAAEPFRAVRRAAAAPARRPAFTARSSRSAGTATPDRPITRL